MTAVDPQLIVDFWVDKGFTPAQARGIARGGPARESGFDPTAWGDGGTSFGLYQHHAERLAGLIAFSPNWRDPIVQSEYAWHELNTTEHRALAAIKAQKTEEGAARAWKADFERPAVPGIRNQGSGIRKEVPGYPAREPEAAQRPFPGPETIGTNLSGAPHRGAPTAAEVRPAKSLSTAGASVPVDLPRLAPPRFATAAPDLRSAYRGALAAIMGVG